MGQVNRGLCTRHRQRNNIDIFFMILACIGLSNCSDSTGSSVRKAKTPDGFTDIYDKNGSGDATCQDETTEVDAVALLSEYCAGCHGDGKKAGGLGKIGDIEHLVSTGQIIPGDAENSPIFTRIYQDIMPPSGSTKPSQEDVDSLFNWINELGDSASLAGESCKDDDGGGNTGLAATDVLQKHCYSCHGANGVSAGGVGDILDIDGLVESGMIVPGEPGESPLIKRLTSQQAPMPPANLARLSDEEINLLVNWVEAGAKQPKNPGTPKTPLRLVEPDEEFLAALNDLDIIARLSPNDARFKRYFSFAHLENAGLSGSLKENHINSLSRFINSISDNRRIVQPRKILGAATIFRVDIRDYGWSLNDWEALISVYPYAPLQQSVAREQSFRALADTAIPIVRADWFVFQASQPEFYHRFLDIPAQEAALQADLGVNTTQALLDQINGTGSEANGVIRSGFLKSGVALNNRVLERHDSLFGAYWVSYDFKAPNFNDVNDVNDKDIFRSPLGPINQLGGNLTFDHDGGEIIFNLPNGLLGYLLVDGVGNRIDVAPQDVVADPDRPEGIINGYSCMTCHAGGLIDKKDEISAAIRGNAGFNINDRQLIEQLYVESTIFKSSIDQDNEIYKAALSRASITDDGQNHIVTMATEYESDVPLALVAAEFGLSADEFLLRLQGSDDELRRNMSSLTSSLTIDRRVLESLIEQIVFEFFPTPRR